MPCKKISEMLPDRTLKSWSLIICFYIVYYSILGAFWFGLFTVFNALFINEKMPMYHDHSGNASYIFGQKPLLTSPSIRVLPSTFIAVDIGCENCDTKGRIQGWGRRMKQEENDLIAHSNESGLGSNSQRASCQQGDYVNGTVCVHLYMNKIFGLEYEAYKANELPKNMDKNLKDVIRNSQNKDQIWVTCQGKRAVDKDLLNHSNIDYEPEERGFPTKYFPFNDTKTKEEPLMVVKFKPQKGALLNVRCRLWAQNIEYNAENGIGFVDFQLLVVDSKKKVLRSPINNERKALFAERPERIIPTMA